MDLVDSFWCLDNGFRCLQEYPSGGLRTLWDNHIESVQKHTTNVSVVSLDGGACHGRALYKVYGNVTEVLQELSRQGILQLEAGKKVHLGAATLMQSWPYYK